ncbi:MAG: hypothetical protein ABSA27_15410 [Terriglobales bacterium]
MDGSKYNGEFHNGSPNGKGTLVGPNGAYTIVGEFKNGAPDGTCVVTQGGKSQTFRFENGQGQPVSQGAAQNTSGTQAENPSGSTAKSADSANNALPQHDNDGDLWLSCRGTIHTIDMDPVTGKPGETTPFNPGPWLFIVNTKAKYILLYDSRGRAAVRMDTADPAAGGWFLVGMDSEPEDDVRMESNQTTVDDQHISLRRVSSHKSMFYQGRPTRVKILTIGRDDLTMSVRLESYDDANKLLAVDTNRFQCQKTSPVPVDFWPAVGRQF